MIESILVIVFYWEEDCQPYFPALGASLARWHVLAHHVAIGRVVGLGVNKKRWHGTQCAWMVRNEKTMVEHEDRAPCLSPPMTS